MMSPKYISIAAGIGFVLSFLIGIFSGIGFGYVLLRALIFAVVFAALAAGIMFLSQKFLSDGQDSIADVSAEKTPRTGGVVDITIDDDHLPEEEQGPQFNVGLTRAALRPETVGAPREVAPEQPRPVTPAAVEPVPVSAVQEAAPVQAEATKAFTPVSLVQATGGGAEQNTASAAPDAATAETATAAEVVTPSAAAGLEELPDIGAFGDDGHDAGGGEDLVEDSEFAEEDEPPRTRTAAFSDGIPASEQSASVMAQAIRTILAKDA